MDLAEKAKQRAEKTQRRDFPSLEYKYMHTQGVNMSQKAIKQSTANLFLGIVNIVILILLIGCTIMIYTSFEEVITAKARKTEFKQLGLDLAAESDYLTNEARKYVQYGEKVHYDNYWRAVNETKTGDKVIARLKELNVPQEELELIEEAKPKKRQ